MMEMGPWLLIATVISTRCVCFCFFVRAHFSFILFVISIHLPPLAAYFAPLEALWLKFEWAPWALGGPEKYCFQRPQRSTQCFPGSQLVAHGCLKGPKTWTNEDRK